VIMIGEIGGNAGREPLPNFVKESHEEAGW